MFGCGRSSDCFNRGGARCSLPRIGVCARRVSERAARVGFAGGFHSLRLTVLRWGRLRLPARSRSHARLRLRIRLLQLGRRSVFAAAHRGVRTTRERARCKGGFRRRIPLPAPHRECHAACFAHSPPLARVPGLVRAGGPFCALESPTSEAPDQSTRCAASKSRAWLNSCARRRASPSSIRVAARRN